MLEKDKTCDENKTVCLTNGSSNAGNVLWFGKPICGKGLNTADAADLSCKALGFSQLIAVTEDNDQGSGY